LADFNTIEHNFFDPISLFLGHPVDE